MHTCYVVSEMDADKKTAVKTKKNGSSMVGSGCADDPIDVEEDLIGFGREISDEFGLDLSPQKMNELLLKFQKKKPPPTPIVASHGIKNPDDLSALTEQESNPTPQSQLGESSRAAPFTNRSDPMTTDHQQQMSITAALYHNQQSANSDHHSVQLPHAVRPTNWQVPPSASTPGPSTTSNQEPLSPETEELDNEIKRIREGVASVNHQLSDSSSSSDTTWLQGAGRPSTGAPAGAMLSRNDSASTNSAPRPVSRMSTNSARPPASQTMDNNNAAPKPAPGASASTDSISQHAPGATANSSAAQPAKGGSVGGVTTKKNSGATVNSRAAQPNKGSVGAVVKKKNPTTKSIGEGKTGVSTQQIMMCACSVFN